MEKEKYADFKLAANTIRCLSADAIQKAKSGHPGLPLGMADVAAVLWLKYLNFDPKDPGWPDRDRFVLSGGHGSMLLYSLLHLSGCGLALDDLKQFRQFGSKTPGHPEYGHTIGVETSTGPLGQGVANGVGMALSAKMLASRFPSGTGGDGFAPVSHRTIVFCGDGDMEEGISHEACALAGNLALDNLFVVFDSNGITIEGKTSLADSTDVAMRFKAYGWRVLEMDGHDYAAIDKTFRKAFGKPCGRPTLIVARTTIGKGSPNKQGSAACHGAPLGDDEIRLVKQWCGFDPDVSFYVPEQVYESFAVRARRMHRLSLKWNQSFKAWRAANPEHAASWDRHFSGELPDNLENLLPEFDTAKPVATRAASGAVLNSLAPAVPALIGGSADLAPSNNTYLKGLGDVSASDFSGRNLHFGIRELAMAAIMNGIAVHGGFKVFGGTFFVFSDYCRPALRVAAMMKLPVVFVFTHDSFYVGEDGPTHEPVEQIAALRAMPGVTVIRPAEATETAAAWLWALRKADGPVALLLSRQNLDVIDRKAFPPACMLEKGAYALWQTHPGLPDAIIVATGSEVGIALSAAKSMSAKGCGKNIRVVSMPSRELFARQDVAYRDEVLPPGCARRLVVEAGVSFGWEGIAGPEGRMLSVEGYGLSGPYKALAAHFGFTVENVVSLLESLLQGGTEVGPAQ